MKKFTFTLAMAAFAVASGFGQVANETSVLNSAELSQIQQKVSNSTVFMKKTSAKAPARISSVSDVYGQYQVTGMNLDQDKLSYGATVIAGSTPNEVLFKNFPYGDIEYPAIVDVEAGTITFRPFDTGLYNSQYGENQFFGPMGFTPEGENLRYTALDELVATIEADGSIVLPPYNDYVTGFGSYISQGFFAGFIDLTITPVYEWVYNADEWKFYGKGDFEEAVINSLNVAYNEPTVPAYEVNVLVNKSNPDLYLIENPYQYEAWKGENSTPDAEGFIMLNAENPDCVLCEQLVFSGLSIPNANSEITGINVFNMESNMILSGYEPEDIIDEFGANDEPVSNYNAETGLFSIYNVRFTFMDALLSIYSWNNVEMLPSSLQLNLAGVDGVEVDNSNAPVKYFNLQGVEVANPEQGQLLIKKQGSKAQKIVVR